MDSDIIRFYRDGAPLAGGRTLSEVLRLPDDELEDRHDFIQWTFPLAEPSMFNPSAPLLTDADRKDFTNPALRLNFATSFKVMLRFYGFTMEQAAVNSWRVVRAKDFPERSARWLFRNNHNHLRITRMLKSAVLLGYPELSRAFLVALECLATIQVVGKEKITAETLKYWREAVRVE